MNSADFAQAALLRPRIAICVGTGGVGKTTVAAALALEAARRGRRTLVLTIDPARRLADALGVRALGNQPEALPRDALTALGVPAQGSLSALMLDMKRTFDDLVERFADSPETRARILAEPDLPARLGGAGGKHRVLGDGEDLRAGRAARVRPDRGRHAAFAARARLPGSSPAPDRVPRQPDRAHADPPRVRGGAARLPALPARSEAGAPDPGAGERHRLPAGRVGVPARLRGHERGLSAAGGQRARAAARTRDGLRDGRRRRPRLGATSAGTARAADRLRRLAQRRAAQPRAPVAGRRLASRPSRCRGLARRRWPRRSRRTSAAGFPAPEAARAALDAAAGYAAFVRRDARETAALRGAVEKQRSYWGAIPELAGDVHDLAGLARIARAIFGSEADSGREAPHAGEAYRRAAPA